jgi:hypothetical protein
MQAAQGKSTGRSFQLFPSLSSNSRPPSLVKQVQGLHHPLQPSASASLACSALRPASQLASPALRKPSARQPASGVAPPQVLVMPARDSLGGPRAGQALIWAGDDYCPRHARLVWRVAWLASSVGAVCASCVLCPGQVPQRSFASAPGLLLSSGTGAEGSFEESCCQCRIVN